MGNEVLSQTIGQTIGLGLTPTVLDQVIPWVAFGYGCIMVFVFQNPQLLRLAEERIPEPHRSRFLANIRLGWISLFVGSIWILQNLWLA